MKIETVLYMQTVHYRDIFLFIKSSLFKGYFQLGESRMGWRGWPMV